MVETCPRSFALSHNRRVPWRPPERLTVTEWADKYRFVQGARAGRWKTANTPYLQGPMDAFADPNVNMLVFVSSAQVGKTEALNNMLAYAIDQEPGPAIYIYPVEKDTREEVRDRIKPMIEESPRLAGHIPYRAWQTDRELHLDTMRINMGWAKAPSSLIRRAARYVFIDEVDNCDMQSGKLGNTVSLARKRTTTYGRRGKIALGTTPSNDYGSGWTEWERSDRREYHVPCPLCGTYQTLRFDQVKVAANERDSDKIRVDGLAWYECAACHGELKDGRDKRWMIERGVWVPGELRITEKLPLDDEGIVDRAVFDHPERWTPATVGTRKTTDRAGFHMNAIYSLFVDWSSIIAEFFESKDYPERLRVFYNSVLGLPYKNEVDAVELSELDRKREQGIPKDVVPDEALALVAFADVQADYLYYGVRAWGERRRNWLIREGIVMTFAELWEIVTRTYRTARGEARSVAYLAVDSGYRTHEVYEFARTHPGVHAMKGEQSAPYGVKPSRVDYSTKGTAKRHSLMLYRVNTSLYKEMLSRMIHVAPGEPGEVFLHSEASDDYVQQMSSEHQVWKTVMVGRSKRRVAVWEPREAHTANHYWDAEIYGLAIADFRGLLGLQAQTIPPSTPAPSPEDVYRERPMESAGMDRPRYGRRSLGWRPRRLMSR